MMLLVFALLVEKATGAWPLSDFATYFMVIELVAEARWLWRDFCEVRE
jgi:hypothetical protein